MVSVKEIMGEMLKAKWYKWIIVFQDNPFDQFSFAEMVNKKYKNSLTIKVKGRLLWLTPVIFGRAFVIEMQI